MGGLPHQVKTEESERGFWPVMGKKPHANALTGDCQVTIFLRVAIALHELRAIFQTSRYKFCVFLDNVIRALFTCRKYSVGVLANSISVDDDASLDVSSFTK